MSVTCVPGQTGVGKRVGLQTGLLPPHARYTMVVITTVPWSDLLDFPVGSDDERQPVGELAHEGDVELRAVQVGNARADV